LEVLSSFRGFRDDVFESLKINYQYSTLSAKEPATCEAAEKWVLEVIAWSIINLDDFVLRDPRTLAIAIFVKQQTDFDERQL
jgi:hypothetical protein